MNTTQRRLLLAVARVLDKVPVEKFDMDTYGRSRITTGRRCATAACVMGWATTVPAIAKRLELRAMKGQQRADLYLDGDYVNGGLAARIIFGLDDDASQLLVYCAPYNPQEKAKQIRGIVHEMARRIHITKGQR